MPIERKYLEFCEKFLNTEYYRTDADKIRAMDLLAHLFNQKYISLSKFSLGFMVNRNTFCNEKIGGIFNKLPHFPIKVNLRKFVSTKEDEILKLNEAFLALFSCVDICYKSLTNTFSSVQERENTLNNMQLSMHLAGHSTNWTSRSYFNVFQNLALTIYPAAAKGAELFGKSTDFIRTERGRDIWKFDYNSDDAINVWHFYKRNESRINKMRKSLKEHGSMFYNIILFNSSEHKKIEEYFF